MSDKLLTRQEVAELLGTGTRKVDDFIRRGELEAIRLGSRTIRVMESSLHELLGRRRTEQRGR